MKKVMLLSILAASLTTPAMAETEFNDFYIGASVQQSKFKVDGESSKSKTGYRLTLGDEVNFAENQTLFFEGNLSKVKKVERDEVRGGYKYKIQLGEHSVSPKVAVGYEQIKDKTDGDTLKVERTYAELGVEGRINVARDWFIKPEVSYQKDLHAKLKADGFSEKMKKGDAYKIRVGAEKELVAGKIEFAPYYSVYNMKLDGSSKSKLQEGGLQVLYHFN